jgi:hypothetical protein
MGPLILMVFIIGMAALIPIYLQPQFELPAEYLLG